MEGTLEPIFKSALETIKIHEIKHNEELKQKNTEIDLLNQILEKQKEEMADFLKVSFANRWKKKSEELEIQNQNLEIKIEKLVKVNEELNFKLDKMTEKKDISTQKDLNIKLKTKKATYKVDKLNLLSDENKIIGYVE
tara:strand:+ start:3457 stop:3870 length:414 start_codon:yes stop_codon:yes gene_type:complete